MVFYKFNNGYGFKKQEKSNSCWRAAMINLGRFHGLDYVGEPSQEFTTNSGLSMSKTYQFLSERGFEAVRPSYGGSWTLNKIENLLKKSLLFAGGSFYVEDGTQVGHTVNVVGVDQQKKGVYIFEPYLGVKYFLPLKEFNRRLYNGESVWALAKNSAEKLSDFWQPMQRPKDYVSINDKIYSHFPFKDAVVDKLVTVNTPTNQMIDFKAFLKNNSQLKGLKLYDYAQSPDHILEIKMINKSRNFVNNKDISKGPFVAHDGEPLVNGGEYSFTANNFDELARKIKVFSPLYMHKNTTHNTNDSYYGTHCIKFQLSVKEKYNVQGVDGKQHDFNLEIKKSPVIALRTISIPQYQSSENESWNNPYRPHNLTLSDVYDVLRDENRSNPKQENNFITQDKTLKGLNPSSSESNQSICKSDKEKSQNLKGLYDFSAPIEALASNNCSIRETSDDFFEQERKREAKVKDFCDRLDRLHLQLQNSLVKNDSLYASPMRETRSSLQEKVDDRFASYSSYFRDTI